jgi:GNAT superfamily N-acetyltransferase
MEDGQMDVEICQGQWSHHSAIVEFQTKMAWETEGLQLSHDTLSAGVLAVLKDRQKGVYWLAQFGNQVIGSMLLVLSEWSDWRNGEVLWIHSVYVVPDFRGRGIFAKLYNTLKELVQKDENLKGLRLYVDKSNRSAHQIYTHLGMNQDHYSLFEWLK